MESMVKNKEICEFALKYHKLYVNPQTTEDEVKRGFAKRCLDLGFASDGETRFVKAVSKEAFEQNEALDQVIDEIDDMTLLGSAIFSRWESQTHEGGHSSLLDDAHRKWFITALGRLAVLAAGMAGSPFLLTGALKKIQIRSNNICFGPCPAPEEETEQHLTITANGRVWLSRYRYGEKGDSREPIEKSVFRIPAESADAILNAVGGYFSDEYDLYAARDAGSWSLILTKTNGHIVKMNGSLDHDLQGAEGGLSDLIRAKLGRNDLFVFDGNPASFVRIEITYTRTTKIRPGAILNGAAWEYKERLTIDRASGTLAYIREILPGCTVTNTYSIEGGIANFLDTVDSNTFNEVKGNPPDVLEDPLETKAYTITLLTKRGEKRAITGTFDKNGLPVGWPQFMDRLCEFMAFYGYEELFDERVYGKARRRKSDCVFCNVVFEEGGRTYCYLADSDAYCEGDFVVVPAGQDNHEAIARIESIEYHPANEAPFPMEKTKHILRGYEEDDTDG